MNRGQEILVMTVKITDIQSSAIIVHEFDSPKVLAQEFILKIK